MAHLFYKITLDSNDNGRTPDKIEWAETCRGARQKASLWLNAHPLSDLGREGDRPVAYIDFAQPDPEDYFPVMTLSVRDVPKVVKL